MSDAATKLGFDPVALNRESIDAMVQAIRDLKAGKRIETGFDSPLSWARRFGFVEECKVDKPCKSCGRPQVDYRYNKITPAGRAFLALAENHHG